MVLPVQSTCVWLKIQQFERFNPLKYWGWQHQYTKTKPLKKKTKQNYYGKGCVMTTTIGN